MTYPGSYTYGGTKPDWIDGDFNYGGRVDSDDYGLWSNTMTTPGANYNLGFDPDGPISATADARDSGDRRIFRSAIGPSRSRQAWPF